MCFFHLLLGVNHIFPKIKPENRVYRYLRDNFNNRRRDIFLTKKLAKVQLAAEERQLALYFLNRVLVYNPDQRPLPINLLNDPLFSVLHRPNRALAPTLGSTLYPLIWLHPPEEIGPEPYLSFNFLLRLTELINPLAETYFIAADFFHRALAHLYILHDYFRRLPFQSWRGGCSLTEIISLGVLTSLWIALKANENYSLDADYMMTLANGHISAIYIREMERQLIVGLKGIIYRWNVFREAENWSDLVAGLEATTNIFQYPRQPIRRDSVSISPNSNGEDNPYQARFRDIYHRSHYYAESQRMSVDELAQQRHQHDWQAFFGG